MSLDEYDYGSELRKQYYVNHKYCPKCGSDGGFTTLMSILFDPSHPEEYRDRNRYTCDECDYVGTVHDRVGKK